MPGSRTAPLGVPRLVDSQVRVAMPRGAGADLLVGVLASASLAVANAASAATNPDQKNTSGQFTTTLLDRDTTVYVMLRKGDCSSPVTSINIKFLLTLELLIPNAFTPNVDGHNDIFRIKNPGLIKTLSLNIFDRWGQKVFESADPYKGWDGSFNGRPLPVGTYVWNIHYTDVLGNSHNRRGTVILIH